MIEFLDCLFKTALKSIDIHTLLTQWVFEREGGGYFDLITCHS